MLFGTLLTPRPMRAPWCKGKLINIYFERFKQTNTHISIRVYLSFVLVSMSHSLSLLLISVYCIYSLSQLSFFSLPHPQMFCMAEIYSDAKRDVNTIRIITMHIYQLTAIYKIVLSLSQFTKVSGRKSARNGDIENSSVSNAC